MKQMTKAQYAARALDLAQELNAVRTRVSAASKSLVHLIEGLEPDPDGSTENDLLLLDLERLLDTLKGR